MPCTGRGGERWDAVCRSLAEEQAMAIGLTQRCDDGRCRREGEDV